MKLDHLCVIVRKAPPSAVEERLGVRSGSDVIHMAVAFAPEAFVAELLRDLVDGSALMSSVDGVVVEVLAHDGARRFADIDRERANVIVARVRRVEALQQRGLECQKRACTGRPLWDLF